MQTESSTHMPVLPPLCSWRVHGGGTSVPLSWRALQNDVCAFVSRNRSLWTFSASPCLPGLLLRHPNLVKGTQTAVMSITDIAGGWL